MMEFCCWVFYELCFIEDEFGLVDVSVFGFVDLGDCIVCDDYVGVCYGFGGGRFLCVVVDVDVEGWDELGSFVVLGG